MHGVMLGVTKLMLKLWFSNEHKKESFSVHDRLNLFDSRLVDVKPTVEITRPPRSYQKFGHDWKASEYRNFLIFYSVPVMIDILPKEQLAHLSLLSHSIHKLLQHSISNDYLEAVERMIFTFCEQFQEIYGKRYMLSNVHQLLHLCIDVRNLGPLWTHSCFPFEDKNRFILQLIHVSQKIEFQLNSAINIVQSIPTVVEQTISKDPLLMSFYESMNSQKWVPVAQPFSPNLYILGKIIQVDMRADIFALLSDCLSSVPLSQRLFSFNRMLYSGEIFHAKY